MIGINRQFLSLTPGYKYRSKPKNNPNQNRITINNGRRSASLKAYRAYDKQDLLQQIQNKLQQQIKAKEENRILKQQINKVPNWSGQDKVWSSGQMQMMMVSIQEENHQLGKELEQKRKEIDKLKKSQEYCQYLQTEVSYARLKEQLNRLKAIAKEKRKKKIQQRKTFTKEVNQQLNLIVNKEKGIRQISNHNQQLKTYLNDVQEELQHYKNKNKQLTKKKKQLLSDGIGLKQKLNSKSTTSNKKVNGEYDNEFFNLAIKTKSSKQTSPATIPEVQEESELSPQHQRQSQDQQKDKNFKNSEESSNIQTQSAQSEPGSMFQERRLNDSF